MSSLNARSLLIILLIYTISCSISFGVDVKDMIFNKLSSNSKSLFKAWHFIFEKEYDYNTEEGIRRYKTFKSNWKKIDDHNKRGDSLYRKGLNHLSDLTDEEFFEYYNIKPILSTDIKEKFTNLQGSSIRAEVLDEEENHRVDVAFPILDWSYQMQPVRDQGRCGSCWAFATQAVLEGCYQFFYGGVKGWFSPQQLLDCDKNNNGCNGGWFEGSMKYLQENPIILDSDYPYTAKEAKCKQVAGTTTGVKLKKVKIFTEHMDRNIFANMMTRGPMAVGFNVNSNFRHYSSGLYDSKCKDSTNHAVALVGFGKLDEKHGYFIIKNSWGTKWGEKGYARIWHKWKNAYSCQIQKTAFQPLEFLK